MFTENISENNNSRGFFILFSDNNTFAANTIIGTSSPGTNGITISGSANTVDANIISRVASGIGFRGSSDSFITNNTLDNITFFGIFGSGSAVAFGQGTNRNLIAGNTVRNIGSSLLRVSAWGVGIDLGGGFTTGPTTSINNNIVEHNLIEGAESAGIEIRQSGGPEHAANEEQIQKHRYRPGYLLRHHKAY